MNPAAPAPLPPAPIYPTDLHLVQEALQSGLQPADLFGVTNAQLALYLQAPPAAPTPLAPLVDHYVSPGARPCQNCGPRAAKGYCASCPGGRWLCFACMDAEHSDHTIVRLADMVERVDLTSDCVSVAFVPKYEAVPLCGHREAYSSPACPKCHPLMRLASAGCPICYEDEEGMLSGCPSCKNTMACPCCWKKLVSAAASHGKHVACPLCRTVVL